MTDNLGWTAMHHACVPGQDGVAVVTALKEAGTPVDTASKSGTRPLHRAARYSQLDLVTWLLDQGANLTLPDSRDTPLTAASRGGQHANRTDQIAVIQLLVARGADLEATAPLDGRTPLGLAVTWHLPTVQALLELGADPAAVDAQGRTALQWSEAGRNPGAVPLVEAALASGESP